MGILRLHGRLPRRRGAPGRGRAVSKRGAASSFAGVTLEGKSRVSGEAGAARWTWEVQMQGSRWCRIDPALWCRVAWGRPWHSGDPLGQRADRGDTRAQQASGSEASKGCCHGNQGGE